MIDAFSKRNTEMDRVATLAHIATTTVDRAK